MSRKDQHQQSQSVPPQNFLPDSPTAKKPVVIAKNEVNTYVQLFDDNAPQYMIPLHISPKRKLTDSLNESGSDGSPNTSLDSAWTDVVSLQYSSSSDSSLKTLYASLSADNQKYYQNAATQFYQDIFNPLQFDQKIKLQSLLKQMDHKEPLSDVDREIFIQLMKTSGFHIVASLNNQAFYEVPMSASETGTDDYYTEPSLSYKKGLSSHTTKTIRKEATLDANAYDLYAPIDESLVGDGWAFISPETQFGFDEEDDPNGYIKVDTEDGGQAIYSAATDRSLDPLYGDVNVKRNPLYNIASDEEGETQDLYALATDRSGNPLYGSKDQPDNQDLYALATDRSRDPLYGSASQPDNQDLYALATDRSRDPLYGSASQQDNQDLYALATDRSKDPLYGARSIPSSDSGLKSQSSVSSGASEETADAHSENEYYIATDRSKDPLYGPVNQGYDEEVEYALATDRSQQVYGLKQAIYTAAAGKKTSQPDNIYDTYEALPSQKKRLPEPPPRQERKPAVPARHSLLKSQGGTVNDSDTQPLIMPDDTLPKSQQDFITSIFSLIKNTPIEKEEQKEIVIDKTQVTISRKNFIRRNLHIIVPATIAVGGAVAFLAYWFSRASSSDPESMTTASPDSEALTMCKNASNAALNLGLRLVDGLFSVTPTQANALCSSAQVSTSANCLSFLTQNCTQLFSSQASSAGGAGQEYFGFFQAVSTASSTASHAISSTAQALTSTASTTMTNLVDTTVASSTEAIVNTTTSVVNNVSSTLMPVTEAITNATTTAMNEVFTTLSPITETISSTVSGLGSTITSTASTLGSSVSTLASSVTTAATDALTTVGSTIGSTVSTFSSSSSEAISTTMSTVASTVSSLATSASTTATDALTTVIQGVSSTATSTGEALTSAASTVSSTVSSLASTVSTSMSSTAQAITSTISTTLSTVASTVSSTFASTSTVSTTQAPTSSVCLFSRCADAYAATLVRPGDPNACACIGVISGCTSRNLVGC